MHCNPVLDKELSSLTGCTLAFLGGAILRLLRSEEKQTSTQSTQCTFFRKRIEYMKKKEGFETPWEHNDGFRSDPHAFYYLRPQTAV